MTEANGRPTGPILVALLLGALSYAIAQPMVAPVLPAITEHYDTTPSTSAWVLTSFLLAASVCTPLAGKFGDLFGKGRVMAIILVVFGVGSIIAALAPTIEVVIVARAMMGSAGGIFPLAFGIAHDEFPTRERIVAIGLISAAFGVGGAIGLPLAGVIVDQLGLAVMFGIGIIALPAAVVVVRMVPPSPPRRQTKVDVLGAVLLSIGLAAVLLAISQADQWGRTSGRTLTVLGGGLAVLAVFVAYELRRREPLVDIRLLGRRAVFSTNVVSLFAGAGMFASFLLIPAFVQADGGAGYGFGFSITQAGLMMLPSALTLLLFSPLAGKLAARIGFQLVLALGTVMLALSFGLMVVWHDAVWQVLLANAICGIGVAMAFSSMANLVVAAVPREDTGVASGINTIMRTAGGALGAAVVSALLSADTVPGLDQPSEHAYVTAFAAVGVASLIGTLVTFTIPRTHGHLGGREQVEDAPGRPVLQST